MQTQEGFDLLQLMADNAMDWHDATEIIGASVESIITMTALLNAQNHMMRGRWLTKNGRDARKLFDRWVVTYDALFLTGCALGVVPYDPEKSNNSLSSKY